MIAIRRVNHIRREVKNETLERILDDCMRRNADLSR